MNRNLKEIGIITVRGMDYPPTRRLAEAAVKRGCRVVPIHPYRVWPVIEAGRPTLATDVDLSKLRAVMPRQGAEIKDACLPLITHFEQLGIPVVNGRAAIDLVRNKFSTLQQLSAAGLPVADTVFVSSTEGLEAARRSFGSKALVIKPVSGRQGSGIHLLAEDQTLPDTLNVQLDLGRGLLCQRYIPPEGRQDLRVLIVGDRMAGAMALTPKKGDFRANYHLGAAAGAVDLDARIASLAIQATQAVGLQIAGVDIMVDGTRRTYINEVNYSPGFRGLETATGRDIAGEMIGYVREIIDGKRLISEDYKSGETK